LLPDLKLGFIPGWEIYGYALPLFASSVRVTDDTGREVPAAKGFGLVMKARKAPTHGRHQIGIRADLTPAGIFDIVETDRPQ